MCFQNLLGDSVIPQNVLNRSVRSGKGHPGRLSATLHLGEVGDTRLFARRKHEKVWLLQSRDGAIVPALFVIAGVSAGAVPGVDEIDLAGCTDVRHGIRRRFDIRKLPGARRDYGPGLVGHFPRPEIRPADEADLHVISKGLHRRLSNQSEDAPRTCLASAGEHRPLYVDSGWSDIDGCEIDFRVLGFLRMRCALARKHNEKRENAAKPRSELHEVLPYRPAFTHGDVNADRTTAKSALPGDITGVSGAPPALSAGIPTD